MSIESSSGPRAHSASTRRPERLEQPGILRARELHSDHLRAGCENAAPLVGVGAAPMLACGSDDLVAVRARPVD